MMLSRLPSSSPNTANTAAAASTSPNHTSDKNNNIFDTKTWQAHNIVIVPPQPDYYAFAQNDEFTYSHLYCYGGYGGYDAPPAAPSSGGNKAEVSPSSVGGSGTTTTSPPSPSSTIALSHEQSTFDSSAFHDYSRYQSPTTATKTNSDPPTASSTAITRDPRKGAFTFSVNSEYDLLLHIQRTLDLQKHHLNHDGSPLSDVECAERIMRAVDEYCLQKQWMYHIGSEKSVGVARFLTRGLEDWLARRGDIEDVKDGKKKKFVCVDLGTYCGYSALVMASTLRKHLKHRGSDMERVEFRVYTTEISSKLLNIAKSIFRLAKLDAFITPILIADPSKEKLSDVLQTYIGAKGSTNNNEGGGIDFLLLDHAKNLYLHDLIDLESSGLLRAHSYVAADNVVFNQLDLYRNHMAHLARDGVVETRLEEMNLEYSNNLKDGIEMTVYLKDPPRSI